MGASFPGPIVLLVGALLLGVSGSLEDEDCPTGCSCSRIEQLDIACELMSSNVTMKGSPGSKIDIVCDPGTKQFSIEELPQMTYGQGQAVRLTLRYCPLPPNFALAASRIGAGAIQELYLCNGLGEIDIPPKTLDGLDKLEKLAIYSDKSHNISIPSKAFKDVPSLKSFTINDANVILREDDFVNAPKLTFLELTSCNLSRLPDGIFRPLTKLKKLLLWRNQLQDLTEDQLQGLVSLEQIDLSNNKIKSLHGLAAVTRSLRVLSAFANRFEELPALHNLTNLQEIKIQDNPVRLHIAPEALSSLPLLKSVDLSRSSIEKLPADFLSGSSSLKTLKLTGNKLEELPPGLFKDQTSLLELDLSRNRLEKLNVEIFRPLQALKTLSMDYNNLTYIPPFLFSGLSSLTKLSVSHNKLRTLTASNLSGASNLADVDFSYNNITDPEDSSQQYLLFSGTFTQLGYLQTLDISHNQLTKMPTDISRSATYLTKLNLAYNFIEELFDPNFVSDKAEIDLTHNKIKTINVTPADNSSTGVQSVQRSKIYLDNNPFMCDCRMYALAQRLHNFKPLDPFEGKFVVDNVRCASPPAMAGLLFRRVPLRDFTCVYNENCPVGCTCIFRPYTGALELTCQNTPYFSSNLTTSLKSDNIGLDLKLTEKPFSLNITTEIRTLNISGLGLEDMPGPLPNDLKILDLSDNSFDKIPLNLFDRNLILKLANNPLKCDCWHADYLAILLENRWKIEDFDLVNCSDNSPIKTLSVSQLCSTWRASVIGGILAMLGLITATIAILLLKYSFEIKVWLYNRGMFARWFVIDDDDRKYDAFVSFCHKDEDFVAEHLLPGLENVPQPYKLCIHYRDWMPGEFITTQIAQSVSDSRRTIIVVSKNFLESQWARAEFRTANMTAIKERKTRVIAVLLEDVNSHKELDPELKAYLATNTYLKWGDPWFWDKLRYALPHRKDDLRSRQNVQVREKVAKARANEAMKVVGAYGLDTRLTPEGLIINAALDAPEQKKREQIDIDMHNLEKIKSITELKPVKGFGGFDE